MHSDPNSSGRFFSTADDRAITVTMFQLLSNWRAADMSRHPEPREERAPEGNIVGVAVFLFTRGFGRGLFFVRALHPSLTDATNHYI